MAEPEQQKDAHVSPDLQDEETAKKVRRRAKILKEITDTERTYQHHLELVIQHFEGPLHDLALVPDHVIVTIFSNVRQILSVNQELLEHISSEGVGGAFLRMAPFFKLYSTYANNHERALGTMIEWEQKRPDFGAWRRNQEELPDMKGLKLNSLLITPVQRVPRYKLLLEDLLLNTEKSHPDYTSIEEATKQIGAVANHINEHIRQHENFNKMLAIQRSLAGPGAPRILTPGRIFIKDGPLKKVAKKGGRSHERMFFLFSDIILYAKSKFVDQVLSGSYVCCCVLPLHHCSVDTVFGHSTSKGSLFTITCKSESLLLYSDQKTVQSWLKALRTAINAVKACRQTLRKPSSALQPLRRPGLVQLRKQQKKADPLENAKRTPDRVGHSPRSLKRALADTNMNCLSPRKQPKKVSPPTANPVSLHPAGGGGEEVATPPRARRLFVQATTPGAATPSSEPPPPSSSKGKQRLKKVLMKRVRHISGKFRGEAEEKENDLTLTSVGSPDMKKQGPDCDIEEILDPDKPRWDIFDTAPPDTSVVWRPRLDTDPPGLERPVPPPRRRLTSPPPDDDGESSALSRPRSEISENTSRIWRARPDSEFSDCSQLPDESRPTSADFQEALPEDEASRSGPCTHSLSSSSSSGVSSWGHPSTGSDDDEEDFSKTPYCDSSRDFLERYTFDGDDGVGDDDDNEKEGIGRERTPRRIYHKESESMLLPWRTQWITPSPPEGRDKGDYRLCTDRTSESCLGESHSAWSDIVPDEWNSHLQSYANYADMLEGPSHYQLASRLGSINEDTDSNESSRSTTPRNGLQERDHHPYPDQKTPKKATPLKDVEKSPWRQLEEALETAGGVSRHVLHSPVMMRGNACCIQ